MNRFPAVLTMAILAIFLLPSFLLYFGLASSLGLGTSVIGCGIIWVSMLHQKNWKSAVFVGSLCTDASIVIISLSILFHLGISYFINTIDPIRALISLLPLVIILMSASGAANLAMQIPSEKLHKAIQQVFFWMCGIAVVAIIGFGVPGVNATLKAVFPFAEPSHFALSFIPFLMYVSVGGAMRSRIASLFVGLAFALFLQNLTLLVGCLLVACVALRLKAFLMSGLFLGLVASQLDLSYYVDRLDFLHETKNLSTLVFMQGWELIGESWEKSNGWGLGFQQLGLTTTEVPSSIMIFNILHDNINLKDGGFTLAKFLSEFGIVGMMIISLFFISMMESFIHLRRIAYGKEENITLATIARCFILSYIMELLIRGTGYFTPTTLILLGSIVVLRRIKINSFVIK
jgi:hypothetical protein